MSSDELQLLGEWADRLDPDGIRVDLSADDGHRELYVDLDTWTDEDGRQHELRGGGAAEAIVQEILVASRRSGRRSTQLFAGFRGTGKSTELGRVASRLKQQDFCVLRVAARSYHQLHRALSAEEVAVMLVAGIGEAALEQLGEKKLATVSNAGVWEFIRGRLLKLGLEAASYKLGIDVREALRSGSGLAEKLRKSLGDQTDTRLREFAHDFVLEVAAAVHPRQLVVLVDELDKFTASATRVADVYQQMADLFFDHAELLNLPACHTVFTVPPYLGFLNQDVATKYTGRAKLLPSVKVQERPPERRTFLYGIKALEKAMASRVDLDRLFGEEREDCVSRLARASGGNPRDLYRLMLSTVTAAANRKLPVGLAEVASAIEAHSAPKTILKEDAELLATVRERGELADVPRGNLGRFATAMDQHLMLCYWNGGFWYDAHPLVADKLPERGGAAGGGSE